MAGPQPGEAANPRPGHEGQPPPGQPPLSSLGALRTGMGHDALVAEVTAGCAAHLTYGARVLVAVSGGPDSTALAHLVAEARPDLDLLIGHVRHGLRDDAADAATAADHAAALGAGYIERRVEVEAGAAPRVESDGEPGEGGGLEAAARRVRYAALRRMAAEAGAQAVLVGHTADDQAETVLLNVARGTGLAGLAGMRRARPLEARADADADVVAISLLRPLLRVRRADVHSYVAGEGLAAVEDPTNADLRRRRARARHHVLPALASLAGGPGDPVGALTRLADLARADGDALDDLAGRAAARVLRRWGPARCVRTAEVAAMPAALATRVVRRMLDRGGPPPPARAVVDVLALRPGQALDAVGSWVTCGGGWLAAVPIGLQPLQPRPLGVPGAAGLPELGVEIHVDLPWGADAAALPGQQRLELDLTVPPPVARARASAALGPAPLADLPPTSRAGATGAWTVMAAVEVPTSVRARVAGDRMRLPGGRRTLADVLTDVGVPRAVRDLLPVVVDAHDEALWVPGVAVRRPPQDARAAIRVWIAPGR